MLLLTDDDGDGDGDGLNVLSSGLGLDPNTFHIDEVIEFIPFSILSVKDNVLFIEFNVLSIRSITSFCFSNLPVVSSANAWESAASEAVQRICIKNKITMIG